jgi:hypothetical protein
MEAQCHADALGSMLAKASPLGLLPIARLLLLSGRTGASILRVPNIKNGNPAFQSAFAKRSISETRYLLVSIMT